MAERRVTQVVRQSDRLSEVFVDLQYAGKAHRHLAHLERMGKPRAVIIAFVVQKDLCFVFEESKRGGVDDPAQVAVKARAIDTLVLLIFSTPALFGKLGVWGKS
jgi:hypothetical protein